MSAPLHTEQDGTNAGGLSDEQMIAYLEGRLTGDELRKVELLLTEEGMDSDALEGLRGISTTEAQEMTGAINRQLRQSLKKKKRRNRRGIMEQKWSWMAVAVILLLAVICFAIFWMMTHHS